MVIYYFIILQDKTRVMFHSNLRLVFLLFLVISLFSCNPSKDEVICTTMIATVSIEIVGDSLDNYFTIRNITGDTIHAYIEPFQNTYTVLDDSYRQILENKEEAFRFVGFKGGNIVVDETFVITADKCHISKVSGVNSVTI